MKFKFYSFLSAVLLTFIVPFTVSASANNHLKSGMLIGASSGTVVGLVSSFVVAKEFRCNANQKAEGEPCFLYGTVIAGGTVAGTLIGTGLGALIGAAIPKKQNVSLVPVVNYDELTGTKSGMLLFNKAF